MRLEYLPVEGGGQLLPHEFSGTRTRRRREEQTPGLLSTTSPIFRILDITLALHGDRYETLIWPLRTRTAISPGVRSLPYRPCGLPDANSIDLVKLISKTIPSCRVAVITAHGNMESAPGTEGRCVLISPPSRSICEMLRQLVRSALKLDHRAYSRATDAAAAKPSCWEDRKR